MQNSISEYKALRRNTIIISISNIGSKAIAFLLAPLYSYYLSTEQYGTMDLITTACGLILPIICLDIYEAVFRFANDDHYQPKTVMSTSLSLVWAETIVVSICLIIFTVIRSIPLYVFISILYAEIDSYYYVVNQFARGSNKMKPFAISGVINSLALLVGDIVFIIVLKYALTGWIISFILAKLIACIYISKKANVKDYFSIAHVSKDFLREAFRYCIPLLPNAIMWWVMNLSDRFLITLFIGVGANGIYAVASKVPSSLSVFENIFFQSWQTSAINTIESAERDSFFTSVFENYMIILSVGVIGVLMVLKPIISIFSYQYRSAWMSSGILVIAIMFHALGGNLGAIYAAFKNTKYALYTSLAGAITNASLNVLIIPKWGLVAAALTTLIGYIVVLISRFIHLRKTVSLHISVRNIIICSVLIIGQTAAYYLNELGGEIIMVLIFGISVIIYRNNILRIIRR